MPCVTEVQNEIPLAGAEVPVKLDRYTLEKRRWRTLAEDGRDIAVDLATPCRDGDIVLVEDDRHYRIAQVPETVIEIPLPESAEAGAKLGWFLGNQHLQVDIASSGILLADDPQLVAKLDRAGIHYNRKDAVFSPDPHSKSHHHH
jgi:urease accessory protein